MYYFYAGNDRSCTYCTATNVPSVSNYYRSTKFSTWLRFHFNLLIVYCRYLSSSARNRKKAANPPFNKILKNGGCRWPRVPLMDSSSRDSPPFAYVFQPSYRRFLLSCQTRDRATDSEFLTFPRFDLFISIRSVILSARKI